VSGRVAPLVLGLIAGCDGVVVTPATTMDASVLVVDAPPVVTTIDGPSAADVAAPIDGAPAQSDAGGVITFSTTFDGTESPISEGGAWTHVGLDWTLVETSGGIAYGTQTGNGGYDDSYAHLSGFPPDHSASAVIYRSPSLDGTCGTHEVEIHLRWSDAPHDAHGYECNLAYNGAYAEIVRWNGPLSDFTYLDRGSVPGGVKTGDTLSASIVGARITLYVNGVQVAQATDPAPFATGNPGMGFWRGGACGTTGDYGFTSYEATALRP
jgi:hypothetical protein